MEKDRRLRVRVSEGRNGLKFAMRKLQKMMEKEGIIKEIRKHEFYEKPSEKRRRKELRRKQTIEKARREASF